MSHRHDSKRPLDSPSMLTSEQKQALELITSDHKLIVTQAPPGCGKTFLIEQSIAYMRITQPRIRVAAVAFNVGIATDLCRKLGVDHKLMGWSFDGLTYVSNFDKLTSRAPDPLGKGKLSGRYFSLGSDTRDTRFLAQFLGIDEYTIGEHSFSATQQVGIIESAYGKWCASGDDSIQWFHVPRIIEDDDNNDRIVRTYLRDKVQMLYLSIKKEGAKTVAKDRRFPLVSVSTKFSHLKRVWIESGTPWNGGSPDVVFVDEAQDLQGYMLVAINNWVQQGIRVILCGDKYQELYEWAGAKNAMQNAIDKFGAPECKLTLSHRFPSPIGQIVSAIIEPLAGPDSVVGVAPEPTDVPTSPTMYLAFTNAECISTALRLYSKGIVAKLHKTVETELGKYVRDLANLANGQRAEGPLAYFPTWAFLSKAVEEDERLGDIKKWIQLYQNHGSEELLNLVGNSIDADRNAPIVMTGHTTKGLESDYVEVTVPQRDLDKDTGMPRQWSAQERMLLYVMCSRARKKLDIVGEL